MKTLGAAALVLEAIAKQREQILEAFIAETGLLPSECEQVLQGDRWWVQKRPPKGNTNK